jgi:regulator of replication initiation timing
MMFTFSSLYFKLALLISAVGLIAGIFFYYNSMRDELNTLRTDNKTLVRSIESQQNVIEKMKVDVEDVKRINRQITTENNNLRKDVESLRDKFDERDFGALAARKPKTIERLINRASDNVARCFELASGAQLNEKEKNAKTPLEANNECPNLVNNITSNTTN